MSYALNLCVEMASVVKVSVGARCVVKGNVAVRRVAVRRVAVRRVVPASVFAAAAAAAAVEAS